MSNYMFAGGSFPHLPSNLIDNSSAVSSCNKAVTCISSYSQAPPNLMQKQMMHFWLSSSKTFLSQKVSLLEQHNKQGDQLGVIRTTQNPIQSTCRKTLVFRNTKGLGFRPPTMLLTYDQKFCVDPVLPSEPFYWNSINEQNYKMYNVSIIYSN